MRALSLCAAALLAACAHAPASPSAPAPDAAATLQQADNAHAQPQTLSCDARAQVDAPENAGRYSLHVLVKRPGSIRIEAILPTGDPGAVLVADGGRFALMDIRNGVFYRGPATPRNLSRLLPAPFTPEELVALLTGAVPTLPGSEPTASRREGDAVVVRSSTSRIAQDVWLGSDLRVLRVRRSTSAGQLLWDVGLDDHDETAGAQAPRLLHLDAPQSHTKVDLRLRNVTAGAQPPAVAFVLEAPKGMRIEEVE